MTYRTQPRNWATRSAPSRTWKNIWITVSTEAKTSYFTITGSKGCGGPGADGFYPDFDGENNVYRGVTDAGIYGWPYKTTDTCITRVPFISDLLYSTVELPPVTPIMTATPNVSMGHYFNGRFSGVNLAFAEGHVEAHSPVQIRSQYNAGNIWAY